MIEPWFTTLPFFHFFNFGTEEVWYSARFEKDTRYYVMRLEQDLFEYWTINAINGRIKSKLGQSRILAFDSFEEAFAAFCEMVGTRHQHQYALKSFFTRSIFLLWITPFIQDKTPVENTLIKKKQRITKVKIPEKAPNKILSEIISEQMCFVF